MAEFLDKINLNGEQVNAQQRKSISRVVFFAQIF